MKKNRVLLLSLLVVLALSLVAAAPNSQGKQEFASILNGAQEVPPNDSAAIGRALFGFTRHETAMRFRLRVNNIQDVVAAHIHCAPAGVNGPVGVTLFVGDPVSFKRPGVLSSGTIDAPDAGNACGWETLTDVKLAMATGQAYVNVHTLGFPGGEIRGKIQ
jgi:hypothetical protein